MQKDFSKLRLLYAGTYEFASIPAYLKGKQITCCDKCDHPLAKLYPAKNPNNAAELRCQKDYGHFIKFLSNREFENTLNQMFGGAS